MYKTKVFKESKKMKNYWKYVDVTPWTQPKATGNTTHTEEGDMLFTCSSNYSTEPAWLAMDGSMSTNFAFDNKTTGWWQVQFPYTIIVKGLDFYQRGNAGSYRTVKARFYTGSTKSTPIGNEFEASTTSFALTQIVGIPEYGIVTDTIYLEITEGVASAGMGELIITADRGSVVPATPDDYDYFTEETAEAPYKVLKSNGKFKVLLGEEAYDPYWHQPVLTANGTMGVDDFAVAASGEHTGDPVDHHPFRVFDNDPDTQWQKNNVSTFGFNEYILFFIKEGVKLQSLEITNTSQNYTIDIGGIYIEASNDKSSWSQLTSNPVIDNMTTPSATWTFPVDSQEKYKYFRMNIRPGYSTAIMIAEIKIHALKA